MWYISVLLISLVHTRKQCDGEQNGSRDVDVFTVRLAGAWPIGRILFIFDIQEFIHHISVTDEHEYPSSKNWGP
jgi:hypothetical protein